MLNVWSYKYVLVLFCFLDEGSLRDDVVVVFLLFRRALGLLHGIELLLFAFFLGVSDLLEPGEVFTSLLVELVLNVGNRIRNAWDQHKLQGIDSAIRNLQSSVNRHELRLERGDGNEDLEELGELFTCIKDGLTTA